MKKNMKRFIVFLIVCFLLWALILPIVHTFAYESYVNKLVTASHYYWAAVVAQKCDYIAEVEKNIKKAEQFEQEAAKIKDFCEFLKIINPLL